MTSLLSRVKEGGQAPTVAAGVPVLDLLSKLEGGESPVALVRSSGVETADLVAALAFDALGPSGSEGPMLVQSRSKRPRLAAALGEPCWAELLSEQPRPLRLSLASALFLIHDFWDAAHDCAQQADDSGENAFAPYWHGVAHRREPDSGNASYWFRRVGRSPIFPVLARTAKPILDDYGDSALTARLLGSGSWNPFAFIELCADGRLSGQAVPLARALQRLEMAHLLDATAEALGLT
jgi:hypothetical protein